MLSVDQLEPLVQEARATKNACRTDKELRLTSDKAFCDLFVAQRHAMLYQRKLFEAGMARTYAEQLASTPGRGRLAEAQRLRASELEAQAAKHKAASEKRQEAGDQLGAEAMSIMQRRARNHQGAPARARPADAPPAHPDHIPVAQPNDNHRRRGAAPEAKTE